MVIKNDGFEKFKIMVVHLDLMHIGRSIITRHDKSDFCVRTCLSNVQKMFNKSVKRMESIV